VCFGLRFSNLTHRGIISRGPYAIVRHPAYAAKNFSWWCVMLPSVLWEIWTQRSAAPLLQVVGMVLMSGIYFCRAITEERHLSRDQEYRNYMKKVPYRFIPGVL
jgi:protein-S-isoprenylcysteine O-methyltransferase Ste14